ncbi:MAG TPA: hypothetical protein DCP03_03495 [Polaromonas sp.]|uniref:hypothetical protein n=1 Tax=Polaromonas sp. UBA4122 TaxID=1947074 RepID=UPI000EC1A7FE|nr:hypothetical protein [Polaromonas sp. UBA4122]HAL37214.1 hypothetical protein [Polaromonas sp.]
MSQLRGIAQSVTAGPSLRRLERLCSSSTELRFVGAIIAFLSNKECTDILSEWSPDCPHAPGLDRLARSYWLDTDLLNAIRPFQADQRVEDRFRLKLEDQYLASLAAARRALPADETSAWMQRLRLYILIRALDALDESVARERHLLVVCRTLRTVCETTGHPHHKWIENLVGSARGYFEFQAETTMKCRAALAQSDEPSGRAFFQALLSILEGRKWIALPVKNQAPAKSSLEPYLYDPDSQNWLALLASLDKEPSGKAASFGDIDGNGTGIATQRTNEEHSEAKRRRLGDGLRLEGVEHALFLRHSWHQLTTVEENLLFERIKELLKADALDDRFGAAVTLIAVLSTQTMHDVGKLSLASEPTSGWRLDLKASRLIREPPRFARRWRSETSDSDARPWIHPLARQWIYEIESAVLKPIRAAQTKVPAALTFGDLWIKISSVRTLATWFNTRFTNHEGLSRLSGPSVANPLAMRVFENSLDQSLAQLVASDRRTALPAACACGSYRAPQVLDALGSYVRPGLASLIAPIVDVDLNCCGSELDLRLPLLRAAIGGLVKRVDAAA